MVQFINRMTLFGVFDLHCVCIVIGVLALLLLQICAFIVYIRSRFCCDPKKKLIAVTQLLSSGHCVSVKTPRHRKQIHLMVGLTGAKRWRTKTSIISHLEQELDKMTTLFPILSFSIVTHFIFKWRRK